MSYDYSVLVVTSIHPDFDSRIWKLCTSLARKNCKVSLICGWKVPYGEVLEDVTFLTFTRAKSRIVNKIIIPFKIIRLLIKRIGKNEIIHFHDIDLLPLMTVISIFTSVVYDIHENYPEEMLVRYWVPRPLRKILYFLVRYSQIICCKIIKNIILVNPSQTRHLSKKGLNIFCLYNYATVELLGQRQDDYTNRKDLVLFTGSCYESNGLSLFLEIATRISAKNTNIKFAFPDRFGENTSYRNYIFNYIQTNHLQEIVFAYQNVLPQKLMTVLNTATIAIAPDLRTQNRSMAIPTKLFEFMAAGLPIISSDLPFQKEIFMSNHVGLLAQPEDPQTFVDAINQLYTDKEYAMILGKNGVNAFSRQYNWESQIPNLLEYYSGIINH